MPLVLSDMHLNKWQTSKHMAVVVSGSGSKRDFVSCYLDSNIFVRKLTFCVHLSKTFRQVY